MQYVSWNWKDNSCKNLLTTRKNTKALVLVNSHYLAEDYDNLDFTNGVFTCHLLGRGHVDIQCPHKDKADSMSSLGYSLKFKLDYCKYKCEKSNECLHLQLQEYAKNSDILIATHAHGGLKDFFVSPYYSNKRRRIMVIDENADLLKEVYFSRKDIIYNKHLLETLTLDSIETAEKVQSLIESLGIMEFSRIARKDCTLPEIVLTRGELYQIDLAISKQVTEDEFRPSKLYDLAYCLENIRCLQYDNDRDSLYYVWKPIFPTKSCIIFMSGTTPSAYLERSLGIKLDHVLGEQYQVKRDNLKVVQLLNVIGGRQRLLNDSKLQDNVKTFFNAMLTKHRDQRIILVTSLGAGLLNTDLLSTAKDKIIELLQPIALKHDRKLVSISTEDLEADNIPDSDSTIPVIHYSIRGTNKFASFDVLVELTAHYYHEKSIIEGVKKTFGVDISDVEMTQQICTFKTVDREYPIEKYTHLDPKVRLLMESTQEADIVQSEGRILRGEDTPKTIYRLHNVNVKPYPDKVYKSWSQLLKTEFSQQELTGKILQVWNWITDNKKVGEELTATDVINGVGGHRNNIASRYLKGLELLGYIEKVIGKGSQSKYKRTC